MVRSFFQTLCAARNQGAWLRWLLGVWCDCKKANQGGRWARGRGARLTEREGTERHGCGHGPKARPLGSMHGDDDGGGRGGGGDAPRATLQQIPDDEMMKHKKTHNRNMPPRDLTKPLREFNSFQDGPKKSRVEQSRT